jgi:ribosomal protein S18 acetylase RimI-like enzyme
MLMSLIGAATASMNAQGILQWDEVYPDRETICADVAGQTLMVLDQEGVLKGMVVLNEHQDKEYADVDWQLTQGRQLVVHRLCVHPQYQGQGVAKRLMALAEDYAQQGGYSAIRLDTFIQNPVSVGLYGRLAYQQVGVVTFRKGQFFCFEKSVTQTQRHEGRASQ